MALQRVAGILLISGFAFWVVAGGLAPPRLYQVSDIDQRVGIVASHPTRWIVSQVLWGLGIVAPVFGFVLLALRLGNRQSVWPLYTGDAALAIGAVFGLTFLFMQTRDPAQFWQPGGPSIWILGYVWATLAGTLLFGVAFVQGGYPNWLGYLFIGFAIAGGIVFVALRGSVGFALASFAYLASAVSGIVALRM